ncbi:unnamed protein product, partial [Brassica oleracea]
EEGKEEVCGLTSLPDDVVTNCLVHVSRLDLAALAMTSKAHRSLATSSSLWDLRWRMKRIEPSYYVCLHIFPDPVPRWFILPPVKRQLKPLLWLWCTESGSSFMVVDRGIFIIGGLVNGKPTSNVTMFDCFEHAWYKIPPMKMARAFASANVIDGKLYVLEGAGMTLIPQTGQRSTIPAPILGIFCLYVVDEDRQIFSFSPSKLPPMFVSCGKTNSKPGDRDDWCLIGGFLFSRGARRTILWCLPEEFDWKEVNGLEELQQQQLVEYDITKLSTNYASNIVIFWNAGATESLELLSAEISLTKIEASQGLEIRGKIEWSGSVYKLDYPLSESNRVKVLFAASVFA